MEPFERLLSPEIMVKAQPPPPGVCGGGGDERHGGTLVVDEFHLIPRSVDKKRGGGKGDHGLILTQMLFLKDERAFDHELSRKQF